MKKILFGIFAHPDDEAFGPSGTLIKIIRSGCDVHLICATGGEIGVNSEHHTNLGEIRLREWRTAGKLMGVASQHHLGYNDGDLCNRLFHEIATSVHSCVDKQLEQYGDQPLEVTFMTFDQNGLSGHIDHIVMSMVASYVYYRNKASSPPNITYSRLLYFCLSKADWPAPNTGFVFMPPGKNPKEIYMTEDISDVAEQKREVMCAHYTQRRDAEMLLKQPSTLTKEHFCLG